MTKNVEYSAEDLKVAYSELLEKYKKLLRRPPSTAAEYEGQVRNLRVLEAELLQLRNEIAWTLEELRGEIDEALSSMFSLPKDWRSMKEMELMCMYNDSRVADSFKLVKKLESLLVSVDKLIVAIGTTAHSLQNRIPRE